MFSTSTPSTPSSYELSTTQRSLLAEYFEDYIKPKMNQFMSCQTTEADKSRGLILLKEAAEQSVPSYCNQLGTLFHPKQAAIQAYKSLITLLISLNSLANGNTQQHSFFKTAYDPRLGTKPSHINNKDWQALQIALIAKYYKEKMTEWVSAYSNEAPAQLASLSAAASSTVREIAPAEPTALLVTEVLPALDETTTETKSEYPPRAFS
ncbi:MAG: hypothetical protein P4M14_03030 [Gammaproteobacteria bacterium]|nr:hypothetical protein [Gammaproteobacteria bacterium]